MSDPRQTPAATSPPQRLLAEFSPPTLEAWHEEVVRLLKGRDYDRVLLTPTYEGITLRPMYTAADTEGLAAPRTLPGEAPYLRGTRALGHRLHGWEIAQELPFPTYEEFQRALRADLAHGQTAVAVVLDEATQAGLDPDQAAPGQVGRGGTSIASRIGLAHALEGVDPETTPLYLQAGAAALPAAALLVAWVRAQGKNPAKLRGSVAMDPLCGLAVHGKIPLSLARAYDELALLTRWTAEHAPGLRTVAVYGHPYHEGGASAVEELADALATGVAALRALTERGLSVDQVAERTLFGFSIGTHFFMEIAKLRAARMLWARIIEASGGGAQAQQMTIQARTSARRLSALDAYTNILRATTQAFAAIAGGADSLHVTPFDAPLGLPSERARRLARNTQLLLRDECHLDRVIDPPGGAWFVEALTEELARKAWALFQETERAGGMLAALRAGAPQERIAATAAARRKNAATRREVLVGVNRYPNAAETLFQRRDPDFTALHAKRAARLQALRTSAEHNEQVKVLASLSEIPASRPDALFEAVCAAASQGATVGELTKMLRRGEEAEAAIDPIPPLRLAGDFERLRASVLAARTAQPTALPDPQVFLANLGPIARYMPRLDFTRTFFEIGGFTIAGRDGFETASAAAAAARASGAPIVAIVSTDDRYPEMVPELAQALGATAPAPIVILAGRPPEDQQAAYRQAGVTEFIHLRSDAHAILAHLARHVGVQS